MIYYKNISARWDPVCDTQCVQYMCTDLYLKDLTCMCWFLRELVVCTCDFVLISVRLLMYI